MGKRKDLTLEAKNMILNALSYFESERQLYLALTKDEKTELKLNIKYKQAVGRTVAALGVSRSTVLKVSKDFKDNQMTVKKTNSGKKPIVLDNFNEGLVRRTVTDFYQEKEFPTAEKIHKKLMDDATFPRMSRTTLKSIMKKQLHFKFVKFHGKPVAMEREDIAAGRYLYLQLIRYYRRNGWEIYFQDESWINANHSLKAGWHIPEKEVTTNAPSTSGANVWMKGVGHRFVDKLIGGFANKPSGAGKRLIMNYIGSKAGFLPEVGELFIGKKNAKSDYHSEMNAEHFEKWIEKLIEKIPNKSVIVLDQATYHRRITEDTKNPTTAWRKPQIIAWLEAQNIRVPFPCESFKKMTIPALLTLAKQHRISPKYVVEEMVSKSNKNLRILWLPVAHCELSPIELIWAFVKRKVAEVNKSFKIAEVEKKPRTVLESVTPELWDKCFSHIVKLENLLVEKEHVRDVFFSQQPTSIIANLEGDSDDSSEEWEDTEEGVPTMEADETEESMDLS